jgi:hypothetical protein
LWYFRGLPCHISLHVRSMSWMHCIWWPNHLTGMLWYVADMFESESNIVVYCDASLQLNGLGNITTPTHAPSALMREVLLHKQLNCYNASWKTDNIIWIFRLPRCISYCTHQLVRLFHATCPRHNMPCWPVYYIMGTLHLIALSADKRVVIYDR